MSPKNMRQRMQNIGIILLLVVLVIAAAYVLTTNTPTDTVNILSPDAVIENAESYLGKIITVDGFYYHGNTPGNGTITSKILQTGDSPTGADQHLLVDHSNLNISLTEKIKYRFIGDLKIDESNPYGNAVVILVASEIEQV